MSVLVDGEKVSARAAKPTIIERFTAGAKQLPFTVENVYWMARRTGERVYRTVLVDPGYLTPSDRQARLTVNAPHKLKSLRDALTGKALEPTAPIHVPAGAFRLLDIELAR